MSENNHFYGKTHSEKTRERMSNWHKENFNVDQMRRMGIKSSQNLAKGRKTKIEIEVEEKLKELGFKYKYSKIIKDVGQYDFIIDDNILLEVHGDYWHANPLIYGKDKIPLNERQQYKIQRDIEKKNKAKELGFKYYVIWETDIKNDNWEILNEIRTSGNRYIGS